ncbi:MAG TPA: MerR family transcriptional regulator [Streptosporangiaceae bacterium]|jgi:DNA-binding transcriptional MerR regulator
MRIGELACRTEVPTRLLRYYEDQGLLSPYRRANGYRDYECDDVPRVLQIRGLIDAGVPTAIIREILPCLEDPATIRVRDPSPELVAALERRRDQMDARIQCLARNRDAITRYLATLHPGTIIGRTS